MELEAEYALYGAKKGEWLKDHDGKFVLIRGTEIVGFYDTEEAAFEAGVKKFSRPPFFIHQVLREEVTGQFPALYAGLLSAQS